MKNIILISIFFISFSIAQEMPWGGISVSTSDNLDALSFNPAGLGVSRDSQGGVSFFNRNKNDETQYLFHTASRDGGFGSTGKD